MNALQRLADIQPGGIGERAPSVRQPVDAIERHGTMRRSGEREAVHPVLSALRPRVGQVGMTSGQMWAYGTESAYACINKIADAIVAQTWKVQRDNWHTAQGDAEEVWSGHWLVRLLQKPNPQVVRSSFLKLLVRWYYVNGNAYLWTPPGNLNPDLETGMWLLPSSRVMIVPGPTGVEEYHYYGSGGRVIIPAREVLHLKNLEPDERTECALYLGRSPMLAALHSLGLELSALRYQKTYLDNDALPAFAVQMPAGVGFNDEAQRQIFKRQFNETMQGEGRGRWALLEDGATINPLSDGGQLKDLLTIPPQVREQVAIVLGVPPKLLTWDAVNYASSQSIRADFHANTIMPLATYIGEELTRHFSQWERGIIVRPDEQRYIDPAEARAQEAHELTNGIKTINQARAERGDEPLPKGEIARINGMPL